MSNIDEDEQEFLETIKREQAAAQAVSWLVEASPNGRSVIVTDGTDLVANIKGNHDQAIERANLIAAAPDLLEALKMAVRVIEKADTSEADFGEQGDALFKSKLAIHKAEGCCE